MYRKLANFFTILFFPGFLPTYLVGTLLLFTPYILALGQVALKFRLMLLGYIAAYTLVFPCLLIYFLYRRGTIQSLSLDKLSDRRLPYLITVALILFLAYTIYNQSIELLSIAIILVFIAIVVGIVALISLVWQVSAHAAGMGGLTGSFGTLMVIYDEPLLQLFFYIALIGSGFVIASRLYLGAHNTQQSYVGYCIGLIISIIGSFFV